MGAFHAFWPKLNCALLHGPVSQNLSRAWPNISQKSHCLCVTVISLRPKFLELYNILEMYQKWINEKNNLACNWKKFCLASKLCGRSFVYCSLSSNQLLQLTQFCKNPLPSLVIELIFVVLALQSWQPTTNRSCYSGYKAIRWNIATCLSVTTKTTPSFSLKHTYIVCQKKRYSDLSITFHRNSSDFVPKWR